MITVCVAIPGINPFKGLTNNNPKYLKELASNLLNNFAMNFADKDGDVDTEDFLNTRISFTLFNKEYDEKIYSKFSSLEPIFEEEEVEFDD